MLRSVLRLLAQIDPQQVTELPLPPLPVCFRQLPDGQVSVDVLVTLSEEASGRRDEVVDALRDQGLRVMTDVGDVITGNVELADVARLAQAVGEDVFIEAAAAVWPELDVSVPEAWNAAPGGPASTLTGRGVVIGIVDTGVDVFHPSLRTTAGGTRIRALWDQTLHGFARAPGGFKYGSEWDAAAIDAHLSAGTPGAFPSVDPTGHGTAVAGVAASNGSAAPAGRYVGVAPDADLVVVVLQARPGTLASSDNVIHAAKYVFDKAREAGQRAVVNLSQGARIGPHDARGQFEQAITQLLAADSGHVVVTSAGNTGASDAHARVFVRMGESQDLHIDVPQFAGPYVIVDIWYEVGDQIDITLQDPAGNSTAAVPGSQHRFGTLGSDGWQVDGLPNALQVGASQLQVKLHSATYTGDVSPGHWILRIHGVYMPSGEPVDAWLERGASLGNLRFAGPSCDADISLTVPACADQVLAVGSYALSPALGVLNDFSARGPTRSGSTPSLICAPGAPVTTLAPGTLQAAAHTARHGTSFAAAHVTGAIALMLEANSALTRVQIYDCLLNSARRDPHTAAGPATGWGSGKLDIAAAVTCASQRED